MGAGRRQRKDVNLVCAESVKHDFTAFLNRLSITDRVVDNRASAGFAGRSATKIADVRPVCFLEKNTSSAQNLHDLALNAADDTR